MVPLGVILPTIAAVEMQEGQPAPEHHRSFRDPSFLTRWTRVSLCVCSVSNVVFIWIWISAQAEREPPRGGIVSLAELMPHLFWYYPVQWITVILVLTWIHRASYNARRLGAAEMEFTPLWAIGSFCIPLLWFWMPFQVMKEVWKASSNPSHWRKVPGSPLVVWWWALWTSAFSLWIVDEVIIHMFSDEGAWMGWPGIFSPVFEIPAALLLVVIIGKVHGSQMEHYRSQPEGGN